MADERDVVKNNLFFTARKIAVGGVECEYHHHTEAVCRGGAIENLSVEDKRYGRVLFPCTLNLDGLEDFLSAFHFARKTVEVDSTYGSGVFDRPALIDLYGVRSSLDKILFDLQRQDAELLHYDPLTEICTFSVKHFSKYGLHSDDEDEEEEGAAGGAGKSASGGSARIGGVGARGVSSSTRGVISSGHYGLEWSDDEEEEGMEEDEDVQSASEEGEEDDYASSEDGMEQEEEEDEEQEYDDEDDEQHVIELDVVRPSSSTATATAAPSGMEIVSSTPAPSHPAIRQVVYVPAPKLELVVPPAAPASVVDVSLLLGRSTRVSWGPGGVLCRVGGAGPSFATIHQLQISPALRNVPPTAYTSILQPLLTCETAQPPVHHSGDEAMMDDDTHPHNNNNNTSSTIVPGFALHTSAAGVHAVQAAAHGAINSHQPGLHKAGRALELVDALWGPMGAAVSSWAEANAAVGELQHLPRRDLHLRRRNALVRWLVSAAKDEGAGGAHDDPDPETAEIMHLLCINDLRGAVDRACRSKDYRLGMLLAEAEGPLSAREFVREQLREWRETGADMFVRPGRLRLYAMLAGTMVWPTARMPSAHPRLSVYAPRSWPRGLLQQLLYGCSAVDGVCEAVRAYEQAAEQMEDFGDGRGPTRVAAPPVPPHWAERVLQGVGGMGGMLDVCFQLMKLFAELEPHVLLSVLPEATSPYVLDHRVGWVLYVVLLALGVPRMSDEASYRLHVEFALQLEMAGLWPWAVYVLQHIDQEDCRTKAVTDLLWRQEWEKVAPEQRAFIEGELGVPSALVETAALVRARYCLDHAAAAQHALSGGLWHDAHATLVQHLALDMVLHDRVDELMQFLQMLLPHQAEIGGWDEGGAVFLAYVALMHGAEDVDLAALAVGISHLEAATPRARLCVGEMSAVVAAKLGSTLHHTAPSVLLSAADGLARLPLAWSHRLPALGLAAKAYMALVEGEA